MTSPLLATAGFEINEQVAAALDALDGSGRHVFVTGRGSGRVVGAIGLARRERRGSVPLPPLLLEGGTHPCFLVVSLLAQSSGHPADIIPASVSMLAIEV